MHAHGVPPPSRPGASPWPVLASAPAAVPPAPRPPVPADPAPAADARRPAQPVHAVSSTLPPASPDAHAPRAPEPQPPPSRPAIPEHKIRPKDRPAPPPWPTGWLPVPPHTPPLSPLSPASATSGASSPYASVLPSLVPGHRPASSWPAPASAASVPLWSRASVHLALRVGVLFLLSTAVVAGGLLSLPIALPSGSVRGGGRLDAVRDLTASEIRGMASALRSYAHGTWPAAAHTSLALAALYLWKQAWTFPGTVILNVLLGMVYGTYTATLYTSLLTATGGVLCYLLCRPLVPILEHLTVVQKPLVALRRALPGRMRSGSGNGGDSGSAGVQHSITTYLLLLRLVPVVPWGPMNMCCAMLGVPLRPFWVSFCLGSVPWNFVTTQVGEILRSVLDAAADTNAHAPPAAAAAVGSGDAAGLSVITTKLYSSEMLLKLALLTLASLGPMALQYLIKRRRAAAATAQRPVDIGHGLGLGLGFGLGRGPAGAGEDEDEDAHTSFAHSWSAMPLTQVVTSASHAQRCAGPGTGAGEDKLRHQHQEFNPARTPSPRAARFVSSD